MERIEIQKVDKDSALLHCLVDFAAHFSWTEVRDHTLRVLRDWEFEEWETPFAAMAVCLGCKEQGKTKVRE